MPQIKIGSSGDEVYRFFDYFQKWAKSYARLMGSRDGYFGNDERAFVIELQRRLGEPQTGIFGDREAARAVALEASERETDRRRRATMLALAVACSPDLDAPNRIEAARLFTAVSDPARARTLCAVDGRDDQRLTIGRALRRAARNEERILRPRGRLDRFCDRRHIIARQPAIYRPSARSDSDQEQEEGAKADRAER